MTVTIRPLTIDDKDQWRPLWDAYCAFYRADLSEEITATTFERLCAQGAQAALVAEKDGVLVGIVHMLFHPSTWSINGYCYLEDLYVSDAARGLGVGRALIEAVYAEAKKRDVSRVYWVTEEGNATARQLYDRLASLSDFVQYRRSV